MTPVPRSHRPPGAVSRRLAENLRAIRTQRGLSTYELARRLIDIGWPCRATSRLGLLTRSLTAPRIEAGNRRVDVDDLLALSIALGCSPNRLLLPLISSGGHDTVPVIGNVTAADGDLWAWAAGDRPLTGTEAQLFKIWNAPHRCARTAT